ncbi:peptidase M23 [Humibacillus sp. DSM 29435]|uniref:M23 family metallopeptidase n=1 Tax=Humibacillus sp. DSM 29435 TaxID=1869167 RepID=UPI00087299D1|nr:M23 family metallopeptidase [Humibacillus sp. DSM 29435]OFE14781.1 peptidase M23 [Humibacillus sp. DSM 29435]
MRNATYTGRHRPAAQTPRGRRYVVPVALLSATVAGGLVIREARAGELGPAAAGAMSNASTSVDAVGLPADPDAVSAATAARAGGGTSRDTSREALAGVDTAGSTSGPSSVEAATARARADEKARAAAKAEKQKAAKAQAARDNAVKAAHRWVSPLASYTLTSGYGFRWGKLHPAQDLATPVGSRVHSLSSGTVIFAGWDSTGFGNLVRIQYWDGTVSFMAHNSRLVVSVGQTVAPGQLVSYSGNTGHSTGPHVHLEIHPSGGEAVPPMPWLANHGIRL